MKTVILINGPPRCGKNTLANFMAERRADAIVMGFSDHLKRCVHHVHLGKDGWGLNPDAFDSIKDIPQACLGGMSWREAYIDFSEKYIKPRFGKKWFGRQLLKEALSQPQPLIIIYDSGFVEEVSPLLSCAEIEQISLVHLHRSGTDFSNDSRSYIDLSGAGIQAHKITNDGSPYKLWLSSNLLLERILK